MQIDKLICSFVSFCHFSNNFVAKKLGGGTFIREYMVLCIVMKLQIFITSWLLHTSLELLLKAKT